MHSQISPLFRRLKSSEIRRKTTRRRGFTLGACWKPFGFQSFHPAKLCLKACRNGGLNIQMWSIKSCLGSMWSEENKFQTPGWSCLPSPRFISCHLPSVSPPRAATTKNEQPKTGRQHVGQLPPSWGSWCQTIMGRYGKYILRYYSILYYSYMHEDAWSIASSTLPMAFSEGRSLKVTTSYRTISVPCFHLHFGRSACCFVVPWSQWDRHEHFMSPPRNIGLFLAVMQACILGVNIHKLLTW